MLKSITNIKITDKTFDDKYFKNLKSNNLFFALYKMLKCINDIKTTD